MSLLTPCMGFATLETDIFEKVQEAGPNGVIRDESPRCFLDKDGFSNPSPFPVHLLLNH